MYCRYCGAELKPEAKFCTSCGMKIQPFGKAEEAKAEQPKTEQTGVAAGAAAAKAAAPKAEQPEPAAKMPPEEKKPEGGKSKKGLLLIPLFLLLAGLEISFARPTALTLGFAGLGVGVGIFIGSRQGGGKESDPFAKRETRESSETSAEGSSESTAAADASESGADGDGEAAEREEKFVLADENTELGALQRSIATLNSEAAAGQRIAINEIKHSVGVRNPGESWNSDVFYTLEGYENRPGYVNKNLCRLEQKQLINADTGNLIDYTVYINPNDGVANKIVAIEYLVSGGLEVTEYYYDANRMPRFVYRYLIDNYVAGYAVPDKAGERFLFGSDTLLTWRAVRDGGFKWNCAANASEAERLRKSWPANTIFLYQNENADMRRAFDERESIMLNAAYNTYETVMNAQNLTGISGYAYDEQGQGVENARVLLYRSEDRKLLYEGKTDADGRYRIVVPGESRQYELRLVKAPYRSCEIYGINVDSEQLAAYQTPVYFLPRGGPGPGWPERPDDEGPDPFESGPWHRVSEGGLEPPRPFNRALAPQASASTYSATRTELIAMRGGPRRGDAGQLSTPASRRGKSAPGAVHHRSGRSGGRAPGRSHASGSTPMRAPRDVDSPGSRRTARSRTAADSTQTMEGHSSPRSAMVAATLFHGFHTTALGARTPVTTMRRAPAGSVTATGPRAR